MRFRVLAFFEIEKKPTVQGRNSITQPSNGIGTPTMLPGRGGSFSAPSYANPALMAAFMNRDGNLFGGNPGFQSNASSSSNAKRPRAPETGILKILPVLLGNILIYGGVDTGNHIDLKSKIMGLEKIQKFCPKQNNSRRTIRE